MISYCIDQLKLPELKDTETDPLENHQENGATPPVNTQPYLPHLPMEDALVTPAAPPPRPRVKAGDAALQAQDGDLSDICLFGADYMLYGIYQNWVHQNPGYRLDGRIAEDSKWQARWKKLVCLPTQRYDAPSGKVGKRFVGIVSVELDGVRARKWNTERVIVFQSVILQYSQGVNNYAQTRKRILFQLDMWNRGLFDELLKDRYNSAMGYLVKDRGTQTMEERHRTFSNLVQKGKLCEAV